MSLAGLQVAGYQLLRLIGRGSITEVYLAHDTQRNQQVALKMVRAHVPAATETKAVEEARHLFLYEAQTIAALTHSHILTLIDYGEELVEGMLTTYLVMPFFAPGSLSNWFRQHTSAGFGQLTPEDVAHIVSQAAEGLQFAHQHDIIHQNLKPSNILIESNTDPMHQPDCVVADFRITKFTNAALISNYLAPEQWEHSPVPATDQYALAAIAYALLSGRPAFRDTTEQAFSQPQPPSRFNPLVDPALDAVLLQALSKRPQERFPHIAAFALAFEQATPTVTIPPSDTPTSEPEDPNATLLEDTAIEDVPTGPLRSILSSPTDSSNVAQPGPGSLPSFTSMNWNVPPPDAENLSPIDSQDNAAPLAPGGALPFASASWNAPASGSGNPSPIAPPPMADMLTQRPPQRPPRPRPPRTLLLIMLLLVVILGSGGLLYAIFANQKAPSQTITPANATQTAQAKAALTYPFSTTLLLTDPLMDNSKGNQWEESGNSSGGCIFVGGTYHASISSQNRFHTCIARNFHASNFTYEVRMQILKGDCGGMIFRRSGPNFYYFRICTDGSYAFVRYTSDANIALNVTLKSDTSPAIHQGVNQVNVLSVVASGSKLDLYVNHQLIASVQDTFYIDGQIGLVAKDKNNATEVMFSNLMVWKLP